MSTRATFREFRALSVKWMREEAVIHFTTDLLGQIAHGRRQEAVGPPGVSSREMNSDDQYGS